MSSQVLRASFTFQAPTLRKFNALIPKGERSRVMETLMQRALVEREVALSSLADSFLNDPAFAECRQDIERWDVTSSDGLEEV